MVYRQQRSSNRAFWFIVFVAVTFIICVYILITTKLEILSLLHPSTALITDGLHTSLQGISNQGRYHPVSCDAVTTMDNAEFNRFFYTAALTTNNEPASVSEPVELDYIQIGTHMAELDRNDEIAKYEPASKRGLLIEANPIVCNSLKINSKRAAKGVVRCEVACGGDNCPTSVPFFLVNTTGPIRRSLNGEVDFPWWVSQIGSMSRQFVEDHNRYLNQAPTTCQTASLPATCLRDAIKERIIEVPVPTISVNAVLAANQHVTLLSLDVEGQEWSIMRDIPPRLLPPFIVFEHEHISPVEAIEVTRWMGSLKLLLGFVYRRIGYNTYLYRCDNLIR